MSVQKGELNSELSNLLPLINAFINQYKEDIYPSRKKRLYSSINQTINIISELTKNIIAEIHNKESTDELLALLIDIDLTIIRVFNTNTNNMSFIITQVKNHKKRLNSETSTIINKTVTAPISDTRKPVSSPKISSFSYDEITNDRDANKALRHLQDVARSLSKYWLNQRINDEKVYQLNRTLTWLSITQLPASNDDQITMLKPVPQTRQQHFQYLKNESNHTELLIEIEESLSKSPFWIDGHFMVWESLIKLKHDDAAQSVIEQLSLLIKKTPHIINLKFDDGSEFANSTTRAWIEQQCSQASSSAPMLPSTFIEHNTSSDWDIAFQNAESQLNESTLSDALQPLINGHHQSRSAREAFFWQFSQAKLLSQAKKYDLANALLNWLDAQYSHSVLTHWDPMLEERLLDLWLSTQNQLPMKQQNKELLTQLRERLCCLNPLRVLNH